MAAQIKLLPDQQYIQDGLRGGTITLQEVSIKAIDADVKYQARVMSIDMNHVRKLASIRDTTEQPLAPIVVFLKKGGRYQIGDGFHRLKEAMIRKDVSIRAYVVKVEDWEHDCRLFAAMCNQEMCLPRTKEDVKKAIEMLFDDPACWEWSNGRISIHCGCSKGPIARLRNEYSLRTGKSMPDRIITANEAMQTRSRAILTQESIGAIQKREVPGKTTRYSKKIKGQWFDLGTKEDEAKTRLSEIAKKIGIPGDPGVSRSLKLSSIKPFLDRKLITYSAVGLSGMFALAGTMAGGCIFVTTEFTTTNDVTEAVGKLVLLRQYSKQPGLRLVVVCYVKNGPQKLIELAKEFGIEFLAPDEFADSIRGKKEGVA